MTKDKKAFRQRIIATPTVGRIAVGIDAFGKIYRAVTLELETPRSWQATYKQTRRKQNG